MKNISKLHIIACISAVIILHSFILADIRIRFDRGRTSATVSGRVPSGGRICYFANAKSGQTLRAVLSSDTGRVQIFESGDVVYSYPVELTGDQSVCVDNLENDAIYKLTVRID